MYSPYLDAALHADFSLQFVIWTSIGLFWVVIVLSIFMLLFRAYSYLSHLYQKSRKALYEPVIEQVLMDAPLGEVIASLRPKRWGDWFVVQTVILESMRHLTGPPFLTFRYAAEKLGFISFNLRELRSFNPHRRGRAMDALGVLRCAEAVPKLQEMLVREKMNLKLVAMRALVAAGNPEVLPSFIEVSDYIQPSMMVRLASLMLEFGAPGRPFVVELINRHPEGFHPRALAELLRELANHMEINP